jgi:hypothetical protein|tara:strand:+ start:5665 stop:5778 length:114 start_codon:yes stop_codon:yes gene_type:complete
MYYIKKLLTIKNFEAVVGVVAVIILLSLLLNYMQGTI